MEVEETDSLGDETDHLAQDEFDVDYPRITAEGLRAEEARQAKSKGRQAAAPPEPLSPEQQAENLRQFGGAVSAYAAGAGVFGPGFDIPTFKIYLDDFLKAMGSPTDPLERMLVEQLATANLAIGRLHMRAGASKSAAEASVCLGAVARLMAEVRRTSVALHTWQASRGKQTKAARTATKRKKKVAAGASGRAEDKKSGDSKLRSNRVAKYFKKGAKREPAHA